MELKESIRRNDQLKLVEKEREDKINDLAAQLAQLEAAYPDFRPGQSEDSEMCWDVRVERSKILEHMLSLTVAYLTEVGRRARAEIDQPGRASNSDDVARILDSLLRSLDVWTANLPLADGGKP
jgi:hypothetical protein